MPPGVSTASNTGRPDAMPAASPVTPPPRISFRSAIRLSRGGQLGRRRYDWCAQDVKVEPLNHQSAASVIDGGPQVLDKPFEEPRLFKYAPHLPRQVTRFAKPEEQPVYVIANTFDDPADRRRDSWSAGRRCFERNASERLTHRGRHQRYVHFRVDAPKLFGLIDSAKKDPIF